MSIRSFIAINLNEETKKHAAEVIMPLKKDLKDFRFLESRDIHLTLRFLGNISPGEVEKSRISLQKIASSFTSFTLDFAGLIAFPSFFEGKVLGVKVKNNQLLEQLFKEIKSNFNLLKIGEKEESAFIPHLTVARVKNEAGDISLLKDIKISGKLKVLSLELMKSHPASHYEIIQSFPLCQK